MTANNHLAKPCLVYRLARKLKKKETTYFTMAVAAAVITHGQHFRPKNLLQFLMGFETQNTNFFKVKNTYDSILKTWIVSDFLKREKAAEVKATLLAGFGLDSKFVEVGPHTLTPEMVIEIVGRAS